MFAGQAGANAFERIDENIARALVIDLVKAELERRHTAADPDFETAIAQMVEHADFLDQAQRRAQRQKIDERSEPDALRRPRDGAEIDARHRNHVERRAMMLGDMVGIDARLVGRGDKSQPFVELGGEREVRTLDMIE